MKTILHLAVLIFAVTAIQPARADVDERIPMSQHRPQWRTDADWVSLAGSTPTRYGTEYIVVGRDTGWYRTIRIELLSGRAYVRKLDVYAGRITRSYPVDTWLDARRPVVYVDLGRQWRIDQLAVTTARHPAGAYSVQGSSGTIPRSRIVSER